MSYYNVTVKIATENPKGGKKWMSENYLVDAVSITDAETIVHEDFKMSGLEFDVKSASISKIVKVL
jgi:hypothetical protein